MTEDVVLLFVVVDDVWLGDDLLAAVETVGRYGLPGFCDSFVQPFLSPVSVPPQRHHLIFVTHLRA